MIRHYRTDDARFMEIEPAGVLTAADFTELAAFLAAPSPSPTAAPRVMLIRVREFPGWRDFDAFAAHIAFIHQYEPGFARIALVSDVSMVRLLAGHILIPLLGGKVRLFQDGEIDAARQWLEAGE